MILQGSSEHCSCLCKGHLQVHAAWGNYIIFSPAYLSKCFMVYSCGEKHFGVGRDLFLFLMFLLGWINTFSRNETSGHVGNMESWAPLSNGSSLVTDTAYNNECHCWLRIGPWSEASVGPIAPTPQASLSQPYLKSPSSLWDPINTCRKMLRF